MVNTLPDLLSILPSFVSSCLISAPPAMFPTVSQVICRRGRRLIIGRSLYRSHPPILSCKCQETRLRAERSDWLWQAQRALCPLTCTLWPPSNPPTKKKNRSRQTHFHNPAPAAEVGLWCRSLARQCWLSSVRRSADWTRSLCRRRCRLQTHSALFLPRNSTYSQRQFFLVYFFIYFFRWPPEAKLFCLTRALRVTFTRPSGHSLSS